jgi:hypothetical protein
MTACITVQVFVNIGRRPQDSWLAARGVSVQYSSYDYLVAVHAIMFTVKYASAQRGTSPCTANIIQR